LSASHWFPRVSLNCLACLSATRCLRSAAASICSTIRPAIHTDRPPRDTGGGSSKRPTMRRTVRGDTWKRWANLASSKIAFSGNSAKAAIRMPGASGNGPASDPASGVPDSAHIWVEPFHRYRHLPMAGSCILVVSMSPLSALCTSGVSLYNRCFVDCTFRS